MEIVLALLGAFLGFAFGSFRAVKAIRADAYSKAIAPIVDYAFHQEARSSEARTIAFNQALALIWTSGSRRVATAMEEVIQIMLGRGGDPLAEKLQEVIVLAELSDGRIFRTSAEVEVTVGGCAT